MSRDVVRSSIRKALPRLSLVCLCVFTLYLPAVWLEWEAASAQAQAALLAEATSTRALEGLRGMFARFERATASLRAQDLQGDTVSLTARLLRAEPSVAPASGLLVINNRGMQIASSSVGTAAVSAPVWWFHGLPLLHQSVVTGCGAMTPDAPGWVLARRIDGAQDNAAGQVASTLSEAVLRSLVAPEGRAAPSLDFVLRDTDGCELLHGKAEAAVPGVSAPLVRFYRALLPESWLSPELTASTVRVGNLALTTTVTSGGALGLRASEIDRHAGTVMALVCVLGALTLSLGIGQRWSAIQLAAAASASRAVIETVRREMEDLRYKLDGMAGERDRVLAAIGHDVRTPMNSILGICALLLDGDLDEAQRKWLRRIRASCEALLAMLNGMLEIAAARVDGAEIHREAVDVESLVAEVGEVLRPQAEDKGLDLIVAINESVQGLWSTDPTRLRQVLFNLCGNAIKYTVHGSVEMRAAVERGEAGQDTLKLQVLDTGPGIAEDEREIIFEQFRRGRNEVSSGQEGLGLGLALCREIAALLGGNLWLDSTPGVGSIFSVSIPMERDQASVARGGPLAGRSALVVGLSEGVRRRTASHLKSIGFDVETASDGFLAFGLAERMAYQHGTLDLMVIDAALIGLSADALLARLRKSRPLERLRIVLVANGPVAAMPNGQADATIPHPVEARDLDHAVAEFFGARTPLQEVDPRAPAAPSARILIVEDNHINQALFVDQLNRAGFSTFAASNGREAVEAVQRGGFDGVLMDVQMPEIDGTEATRRIRAEEGGRRIPIVGMTAHTGSVVRRRCLDAGMDVVLHKPIDFSCLPLRLREVIAAAQVAALPETACDGDGTRPTDGTLDIEDEYLEVVLAEVGAERARTCVSAFLADTGVHISVMERLHTDGEWDDLGNLAHSLCGIAGTLGAISLADGLLMLEDSLRLEEKARVGAALSEVRSTWERTRIMLRPRLEMLAAKQGGVEAKKDAPRDGARHYSGP